MQIPQRYPPSVNRLRPIPSFHGVQELPQAVHASSYAPQCSARAIGEMQEMKVPSARSSSEGRSRRSPLIVAHGVSMSPNERRCQRPRILGQIGEVKFFGEMGMLSAVCEAGNVAANTECMLYALGKNGRRSRHRHRRRDFARPSRIRRQRNRVDASPPSRAPPQPRETPSEERCAPPPAVCGENIPIFRSTMKPTAARHASR